MKKNLLSSLMLFAAATLFMSCADPAPAPTPPDPVPTGDVAITAKHAFGSYNEDGKKEGYANFVVALSEVKGTHDLKFEAAGQALVLNLYAPINEKLELPAGKYTSLTDVTTVAGPSVVTDKTNGFTIDADKKSTKTHSFKTIELEVTGTGDSYTVTFSGTTTGDTKYTCTYTAGKIVMTDITPAVKPEPMIITSIVTYFGGDVTANYYLIMNDCTVNSEGAFTSVGTTYRLDLYSTLPADPTNWRPAEGKYDLGTGEEANTINEDYSNTTPVIEKNGTFVEDKGNMESLKGGSVTITHEGVKGFVAVVNITLFDDTAVKFTANNFRRVDESGSGGGESDQTTFMEDVLLKLTASAAHATSWGDAMDNGNQNWTIDIDGMVDNDFIMDIYSASQSTTEIPVGTFTAGLDGEADTFMPGIFEFPSFYPTAYVDYVTGDYAAIADGKIIISKEAGDKYKVDIDVADELGNAFTGTWIGVIEMASEEEPEMAAPYAVKQKSKANTKFSAITKSKLSGPTATNKLMPKKLRIR